MDRPRQGNRRTGFTLIELMVGGSVTLVILGAAYACLQAGLQARKAAGSRAEVCQNARVALSFLAADLRSACPLSEEYEFVGMQRRLGEVEADNLDFATHNWKPRASGESDLCEVSYFVNPDPRTGELGLWRRRDPSPDDRPFEGGEREEIAAGVRGLRFEYSDGFTWFESWGKEADQRGEGSRASLFNLTGLPEAVRITLSLSEPLPEGEPQGARPAGSRIAAAESRRADTPLVFQTVVRLNLAGRATRASSSLGGAGSSSPTAGAASGGSARGGS
jgi:type II secretory pathway pseudopilin PulG